MPYITFNIVEIYSCVSLGNHTAAIHWPLGLDCQPSLLHRQKAQKITEHPRFAQSKPKSNFLLLFAVVIERS